MADRRTVGRLSLALVAVFTVVSSARAEEPSSLRRALSSIPVAVLAGGSTVDKSIPAKVVDIAAARMLTPDDATLPRSVIGRILTVGGFIDPLKQLIYSGGEASRWEKFAGASFAEIDAFASFGTTPTDASLWILPDEARAKALFGALSRRGFAPFDGTSAPGDGDVLANGELGKISVSNRQPGDPWIGDLGRAFAVARMGRTLVQAKDPAQIAVAREASTANLSSLAPVNVVLIGIDAVTSKDTRVIQALVATPFIGLGDTAADIGARRLSPEQWRKRQEERYARDQETGLPPFAMALIADIETAGRSRGVAIVLAYGDCAQAEEGTARFVERWRSVPLAKGDGRRTMADVAPADAKTRAVPGPDGACAAVITLTTPVPTTGDDLVNRPFRGVLNAIMNRDFVAATIAMKAR